MKIPDSYYHSDDVVALSRDLIGKYLFTSFDGVVTGGYIVETEAYAGVVDRASHAYGNRLTPRTQTMYMQGGVAYVYLCYGIHEMLNIVTAAEGRPHAILIRAINPTTGIDMMQYRRNMAVVKPNITSGPGSVAKALGISRKINAITLQSETLWLEDRGLSFKDDEVAAVPRVGVDYAGEDAKLPYRFYVKGNPYVSKPNR
ncbi:DNA-3-methyladenine glycosylase [Mucilaginibacter sp. KACC 22063]|uniref:DNA-3-methyladenine glycosylase n=1 Tax=Mucilaginibacter sp. KACC 22063 TaxID=3025666 RepID=UPI002366167E|nr:DNA-3-methyladenine glycosylase [Mucilaginibacter sp. KACC 22063]WDF53532.1 DNA-3-methyladenine glycosylase [Mucilaginibacter sp. KACC 22063]